MAIKYETYKENWLAEFRERANTTPQFATILFAQWLNNSFDISNEIIRCNSIGDGKIEAVYLQRKDDEEESGPDANTWFLVQSLGERNQNSISDLVEESQKIIDAIQGRKDNLSSLTKVGLQQLQLFRTAALDNDSNDRIKLVLVSIDPLSTEEKKAVDQIKDNIKYSSLWQILDVISINLKTLYNELCDDDEMSKINVPICADLVKSSDILLIGSLKLENVYSFLKSYEKERGDDFNLIYKKNVRMFLGGGKAVNKGIADTIRKKPEMFGLYNNGITIVVEDYKKIGEEKWELVQPYIVNGCQTTRIIYEELKKKLDKKSFYPTEDSRYRDKLSKGSLVVKIVKADGDDGKDLLKDTTKFTNSQNVVSVKDFISLEDNFHDWAQDMLDKYGVFLEMQRGEYKFRKDNNTLIDDEKWANAFELIKIYGAAWFDEPGTAYGYNHPFAPPKGLIFSKIIQTKNFGVDELYAAYLLLKLAEHHKFGTPYDYKRHPTKYLFCNIVIQLVKSAARYFGFSSDNSFISQAVILVFENIHSGESTLFSDAALRIIDNYMTIDKVNSMSKEEKYTGNSNAFLKSKSLGKSNWSPILIQLINNEIKKITVETDIESLKPALSSINKKTYKTKTDGTSLAYTKPSRLTISGQNYKVSKWNEILILVFNHFAQAQPERFILYAKDYPEKLNQRETELRTPKKLINGFFAETNYSADETRRQYVQVFETMGLASTEWNIEYK